LNISSGKEFKLGEARHLREAIITILAKTVAIIGIAPGTVAVADMGPRGDRAVDALTAHPTLAGNNGLLGLGKTAATRKLRSASRRCHDSVTLAIGGVGARTVVIPLTANSVWAGLRQVVVAISALT